MSPSRWRGFSSRLTAIAGTTAIAAGSLVGGVGGSTNSAPLPPTASPVEQTSIVQPSPVSMAVTQARSDLPARSTVTLVTGHRVRLDVAPTGQPSIALLPMREGTEEELPDEAAFTQFQWGGDTYVVPSVALPYLGSTLDIRLFDVSYLVRAELDDRHAAALPVDVTYRGQDRARLPSVQANDRTARAADEKVVKSEASGLGALLAREWRSAERSAERVGRLDGIDRIRLAPSPSAPALREAPAILSSSTPSPAATGPDYHTLTLDPIDQNGEPAVAVGFVQNVDDAGLSLIGQESGLVVAGGEDPVRFSVAEGTYSITTTVVSGPFADWTVDSAFVAKPEIVVDSDTTVTLDARDAVPFEPTLEPPLETPGFRQDMLTFTRTSEQGGDRRVQGFGQGGLISLLAMRLLSRPGGDVILDNGILSATPTEPVTTGAFGFAGITQLAEHANLATERPRYYLAFPTEGRIPASLTYPLTASDLTAVHSGLHSATQLANQHPMLYLPWSVNNLGIASSRLPTGDRVDFWYTSAPDITWWQSLVTGEVSMQGERQTLIPGEPIVEDWLKRPLVPSPAAPYVNIAALILNAGAIETVPDPGAAVCVACRQDDNGMLYVMPLGDSVPSHRGDPRDLAGSGVDFYRNGELAFTWPASPSGGPLSPVGLDLPLLPESAEYRLDWSWTEKRDPAATTTTRWRFRSGPGDPAADLPDTVRCSPDIGRECSFLPLLFVTYDLDLTPALTAPANAPFEVEFVAGGQQHAPPPSGLSATVAVSYDDGQTWTDPRVASSQGGGRFALSIQHPPLGETSGYVSLRVRVDDAAGDSVEQELIHAYALHGE